VAFHAYGQQLLQGSDLVQLPAQFLVLAADLFQLAENEPATAVQIHEHRQFAPEHGRADRLENEVYGPSGIPFELDRVGAIYGGNKDDRGIFASRDPADAPGDFKPIDVRHLHVEQYHGILAGLGESEGFTTRPGLVHDPARRERHPLQDQAVCVAVVDHENRHGISRITGRFPGRHVIHGVESPGKIGRHVAASIPFG